MKISEVLDKIKLILDSNQRITTTQSQAYMVFGNVVFDGVSFFYDELKDDLCYDYHNKVIVYINEEGDPIIVPENDKIELFNFFIANNLSPDNIETFRRLIKRY